LADCVRGDQTERPPVAQEVKVAATPTPRKLFKKAAFIAKSNLMTPEEMYEWQRKEDMILLKEDENSAPDGQAGAGGTAPAGAAAGTPQPGAGAAPPPDAGGETQPGKKPEDKKPADISKDPQAPDMPDEKDPEDFERWKNNYLKESIKGDSQKLIDMINDVRDLDLMEYPRKFVEDNLQIQFLRQNSNIEKASKEIRKLIREQLDQNNPSVSCVNHRFNVLQQDPTLSNVFIKLEALHGMKGDLHRKYVAALLGGVPEAYQRLHSTFRWAVPEHFNIAEVCCGRWARQPDATKRVASRAMFLRVEP
jgi:hypothetical protein